MYNPATKSHPALTVPTLRETTLFLLSPSRNLPEDVEKMEENEFIFTRHHSPASD